MVVLDADSREVLWVGEGKTRAAIRPFFEWLGPEACQRIEAVGMDMNTTFDLEVQKHCPQARVVYDLFHVVAKFGREVSGSTRPGRSKRTARPTGRSSAADGCCFAIKASSTTGRRSDSTRCWKQCPADDDLRPQGAVEGDLVRPVRS